MQRTYLGHASRQNPYGYGTQAVCVSLYRSPSPRSITSDVNLIFNCESDPKSYLSDPKYPCRYTCLTKSLTTPTMSSLQNSLTYSFRITDLNYKSEINQLRLKTNICQSLLPSLYMIELQRVFFSCKDGQYKMHDKENPTCETYRCWSGKDILQSLFESIFYYCKYILFRGMRILVAEMDFIIIWLWRPSLHPTDSAIWFAQSCDVRGTSIYPQQSHAKLLVETDRRGREKSFLVADTYVDHIGINPEPDCHASCSSHVLQISPQGHVTSHEKHGWRAW